jgi:hypothetical protein
MLGRSFAFIMSWNGSSVPLEGTLAFVGEAAHIPNPVAIKVATMAVANIVLLRI